MHLISQLNRIISEFNLLNHRFYQAWSMGTLPLNTLQRYAAQYYKQVESFPRFISRVHTGCPHIEVRKVLLQNLVDEEIHGSDHPALWMQFAAGIGVDRESVLKEVPLPETEQMVDQFYQLAGQDWRDGLCALYAYEYQVPAVSASKIDGLKKHYQVQDEHTLAFFTAHQIYDVEHSQQVANLIENYVEPARAIAATREAAQALWQFLDGMSRITPLVCSNMTSENAH